MGKVSSFRIDDDNHVKYNCTEHIPYEYVLMFIWLYLTHVNNFLRLTSCCCDEFEEIDMIDKGIYADEKYHLLLLNATLVAECVTYFGKSIFYQLFSSVCSFILPHARTICYWYVFIWSAGVANWLHCSLFDIRHDPITNWGLGEVIKKIESQLQEITLKYKDISGLLFIKYLTMNPIKNNSHISPITINDFNYLLIIVCTNRSNNSNYAITLLH